MKTAVVYDIRKKEAADVADWLERHDYEVFRQYEKEGRFLPAADRDMPVDLLVIQIDTAYEGEDAEVGTAHDYEAMLDVVSRKIYEAYAIVEAWLPALEKGTEKKIAFLTQKCASIRECGDKDGYVKHMILAGINMQAKLLYNNLRPKGYAMRCFVTDGLTDEENGDHGILCGDYITMGFSYDEKEPYIHSEENRFVMRDAAFCEIAW